MSRVWNEWIVAAAGIGALVGGLAVIDSRVREQLELMISGGGASREVASVASSVRHLALITAQAVRDQSIEHASLTIFTLAALVLLLFMLRTTA